MFQDISLEELLQKHKEGHTFIDVRSPKEFMESTIPGSKNIPVFTNEERAEIGTIYKQTSPEAARERGLKIFSQKLPQFIAEFKKINTPMTVFCWRGGMRSKTAATVLDLMGIHANRLSGGIRSYRQWVVRELEKGDFPPELYVLNGYTGSGKTILLKKLADAGYPIIDLEEMAGHRGSIFGQIGLEPSNQKKFDSLLVEEIHRFHEKPFIFIEGESKRIGKVVLPEFFNEKKEKGVQFFIHLPIEERIKNILADYEPWKYPEKFVEAFQYIKKRIHIPIAKQIEQALQDGDFQAVTYLLLTSYYDPRYEYSISHHSMGEQIMIEATNVDDAFEQLLSYLSNIN